MQEGGGGPEGAPDCSNFGKKQKAAKKEKKHWWVTYLNRETCLDPSPNSPNEKGREGGD